jgi:YidC/Oxa1 family membrane protein insertase
MDKNTIIGLLLIGLLFVGFSYYNNHQKDKAYKHEIEVADSLYRIKKYSDARESYLRAARIKPPDDHVIRRVSSIDSLLHFEQRDTTVAGSPEKKIKEEKAQPAVVVAGKDTVSILPAGGEKQFFTVENDLAKYKFTTLGGRLYSVELKKYKTWDQRPLVLFDGDSTEFGFRFFTISNKLIDTKSLLFTILSDTAHVVVTDSSYTVVFRLNIGEDRYMDFRYVIPRDDYMIGFDVELHGMNSVIAGNLTDLSLRWKIFMPQQEQGRVNEDNYSTIRFKYYQDEVDGLPMRSSKELLEQDIPTKVEWVAFKDQFFSSVLISPAPPFNSGRVKSLKMPEDSPYFRECEADLSVPYRPGDNISYHMKMYYGPNNFKTLKKYGMGLQELVYLGRNIIRWINQFVIIPIFNWLNNYISNYGIIILLLTLIIKMALFPLTYKSYVSQAKMRVLKPFVDEINKKYPKKEDAMKKQQAQMALYKQAGVSPLSGCLPMLLQMPILFAMFRFFPTSIELRQQSFLWAHDLSTYDSVLQLPFTIPMYGDHVSLFTILMTVSTIVTMKLNSPSGDTGQMPGMKGMMYIMPVTFMLFLNNFSAALNYYYFLANLITFGQNMVAKAFVNEDEILHRVHERKKTPVKKSKWQQRLEEAAKAKGYNPPKKKKRR